MNRRLISYICSAKLFLAVLFTFAANTAVAQDKKSDKELAQALEYVRLNRLVDALPLLEKVGSRYPDDAEIQAKWGVAILVNLVIYKDPAKRKQETTRAEVILKRAKNLGTKNVIALHYLDLLEQGREVDSVFNAANKDVEDAIREGEAFFGRGDYDKALASYERAFKLDPKSYEAALFAGDCFYAQKKYKESEPWFGKAAAIDPDREQAFRFWGDALASQGLGKEALEKYAYAYIAEPNSRVVFDTFINGVKQFGDRNSSPFVLIPNIEGEDEIVIDKSKLSSNDGTTVWNRFTETRKKQIEKFNAVANGRKFLSTVAEDVECLEGVAASVRELVKNDKNLKLNKSLENLVKLDSLGMLDIYTILFFHSGDQSEEYEDFRQKHRQRMLRFLLDYFAEDKPLVQEQRDTITYEN